MGLTNILNREPTGAAVLSSFFKKATYFFLGVLIILVCSFEGVSQFTSSHTSAVFCGGVCQPHNQPEQATQTKEASDDQKEPVPPPLSWTSSSSNLIALYILGIIIATGYILNFRKKTLIRTAVFRF